MPKPGVDYSKAGGFLRSAAQASGWSLCVGAGISLPLFPSWTELVARLLEAKHPQADAKRLAEHLLQDFSPDAIIQAASNRSKLTSQEFADRVSDALYRDIRDSLSESEWTAVSCVMARPGTKGVDRQTWRKFLDAFRNTLSPTTALDLAKVLLERLDTNMAPRAILSFNAEPLLFALVNALFMERATAGFTTTPAARMGRDRLDMVVRSISYRSADRVPFIACHGMLPIPGQSAISPMVSLDKLVFSESEYLQLANTSFSWQSSAFLEKCGSSRIVFVGVSLSDPNMRRWLSWVHDNRLNELKEMNAIPESSTTHFWLRKYPKDSEQKPWIEAAVAHLGVRLIWLNDWSDAGATLDSMIEA